ncbi:PaaI family thioesterase [Nocardia vinacea]|uniref:PaaI family thioesterase n=1 Tax=Nocardia vinacea TaxID=96468 RepID=A0ABZ1YU68_9NOCA|nr:PaaI family thioesterase [Nocardia vinacea]
MEAAASDPCPSLSDGAISVFDDALLDESRPGARRPESPFTPADSWIGVRQEILDERRSRFRLEPTVHCEWRRDVAAPGALYVLADAALGWEALHAVGRDEFVVTSNLHLDFATPVAMDSTLLIDQVHVVAVSDHGVLVVADIVDEPGRRVALATARFAIVAKNSKNAGPVGQEQAGAGSGLQRTRNRSDDGNAVSELFDLRLLATATGDADTFTYAVLARPELRNDRGGMHGGVAAMLGEHAAAHALSELRSGSNYRSVESRAVFVRPVPAHGGVLECTVRVLHHGRRQAIITTSLLDDRGRVAVEVSGVFARTDA